MLWAIFAFAAVPLASGAKVARAAAASGFVAASIDVGVQAPEAAA